MMGYADYDFYIGLYGKDSIPEADFNRLSWEACRKLDMVTTGIDGVKKLQIAFPVDDYDAYSVRMCASKLIYILAQIEQSERAAQNAAGYITREDGSLQGKVVTSLTAGNESVSFSTGASNSSAATLLSKVASDKTERDQLLKDTIFEYLSGITDANGVNLLYMGRYPYFE